MAVHIHKEMLIKKIYYKEQDNILLNKFIIMILIIIM